MVLVDRDILFRGKRGASERVVNFGVEISSKIFLGMISTKRIRVKCTSTCLVNLNRGFELRFLIP